MRCMLGATWWASRLAPTPIWSATLIALLTAERAQLDCLRLLGAYCLLAGEQPSCLRSAAGQARCAAHHILVGAERSPCDSP